MANRETTVFAIELDDIQAAIDEKFAEKIASNSLRYVSLFKDCIDDLMPQPTVEVRFLVLFSVAVLPWPVCGLCVGSCLPSRACMHRMDTLGGHACSQTPWMVCQFQTPVKGGWCRALSQGNDFGDVALTWIWIGKSIAHLALLPRPTSLP